MNYSYFVDILDAGDELMEHSGCFFFVDSFVLDDVVEELSPFHELHHQEQLFRGFDDLVQLDDVWVSD